MTTKVPGRMLVSPVVSPMESGAVGDGVANDISALNSAAAKLVALGGGTLDLRGRTYGITSPFEIPGTVSVAAGKGGVKVLPGFSGAAAVTITNSATGNNNSAYAKARNVLDLVIDCNDMSGVVGLLGTNIERDRFVNPVIRNCRGHGIHFAGGYGAHVINATIIGSSIRRGSAGAVAVGSCGVLCQSSDCTFSVGDVSFFPIGVKVTSGHCNFIAYHPWSSYWSDDPFMLIGFLDEGEGNTFTNCNADSPTLSDTGLPASKANGGYGFYGDTDSINRRLVACTVQNSANGNRFPPAGVLTPVYVGKVRNTILGLEVRDFGGFAFADAVVAVNTATFSDTTILGGNINESMDQNAYFPLADASFLPAIAIGGSSVGVTYSARAGWRKTLSGKTDFKLNITLSSRGGLVGSVVVTGLPFANQTGGIPSYYIAAFINAGGVTTGRALLGASSQSLVLQKFDGAAVSNTDITDTTQIIIEGTMMHTYGT